VRANRYRWVILAAGVVAQASFSALFVGMAALAPAIQREYDVGLARMGIVLSAVNIGLVVTLIGWGLLADRLGERSTIAVGLTGSAVALAAAGHAGSFASLVALLVFAGALGGCVQSGSGRAVMAWFAPAERGLALGIRQTAVPAGGFAAALGLPLIQERFGLEWAFAALAVAALVGAAVAALLLRDAGRDELEGRLGRPLRDGGLWLLCGGSTLYLAAQVSVLGFVVLFLHRERGFSTGAAAAVLAGIQVLGAGARIGAGRWSDRLGRRVGPLRTLGVALGISMVAAAALVGARAWVLVPALIVAGTLGLSWNGLSYTAAAERAGAARSGAAIGVQQTALALGGIVVPIAFAAVVDATSWGLGFALVALCPFAGWLTLAPLAER
jgi:sugar phosphate permease